MIKQSIVTFVIGAGAACSTPDANPVPATGDSATATPAASGSVSEELSPRLLRRFRPLESMPASGPSDPRVPLGRLLYYDARLSTSGTVACETCHPLEKYGTTSDVVSTGVAGQRGKRNAPSTYHAAGHFRQFWDGRARDLEDQARNPIIAPEEMGETEARATQQLAAIPEYRRMFDEAFGGADGSAINLEADGVPHPRSYATNPRVLGYYVREQKVLTLEDAIRKMTTLPAQILGLRDRGQIREAFAADLVVFDPTTVRETNSFGIAAPASRSARVVPPLVV